MNRSLYALFQSILIWKQSKKECNNSLYDCIFEKQYAVAFEKSNYNRRKKALGSYLQQLNQVLAGQMNEGENVFIVDSIPVPVCKLAREKSSKICRENFETAPDKGYSAVNKAYYYGYKLHMATSVGGVFHPPYRRRFQKKHWL